MARFISVLLMLMSIYSVSYAVSHGSYVMDLDERFEGTRRDDPYLLEFYAPWCGHCKSLEPVYERVAAKLDGTGIYVAKIDATLHTGIASKYEVHGFPSILYIKGEKVVHYKGDRSVEDLARFAIRCHSPSVQTLHSVGGLKDRLRRKSDDAFFVYIGAQDHSLYEEFRAVAGSLSITSDFYYASAEALEQEAGGTELPVVLVYKDGEKYEFNPLLDTDLNLWVNQEKFVAIQPSKGWAYYDLINLNKTLVIIVAQPDSSVKEVKENSRRLLQSARPVALDRNLSVQFQFVLMESTSTVSSIILGDVPVPYVIAFHPITQVYYKINRSTKKIDHDDWIEFLADISSGKAQGLGGKGFFRQLHRALYGLFTSIIDIWLESRLLFGVIVVIPLTVISIVVYTLCCLSWGEDEGENDEHSEDEQEPQDGESQPGELQVDDKTGHYKTE